MTPFRPEELKHEIEKLHPDKSPDPSGITNRMLQAGDTDFQGLILIFFKCHGNFTHNLQTGNFLCYNQYTKDTTKTKQTLHPTEVSGPHTMHALAL